MPFPTACSDAVRLVVLLTLSVKYSVLQENTFDCQSNRNGQVQLPDIDDKYFNPTKIDNGEFQSLSLAKKNGYLMKIPKSPGNCGEATKIQVCFKELNFEEINVEEDDDDIISGDYVVMEFSVHECNSINCYAIEIFLMNSSRINSADCMTNDDYRVCCPSLTITNEKFRKVVDKYISISSHDGNISLYTYKKTFDTKSCCNKNQFHNTKCNCALMVLFRILTVVRVGFSSSLLPVVIIIPSMVLLLFLFSVLLVTLFLCKRRRDKRLLISTVCWKCQGGYVELDHSKHQELTAEYVKFGLKSTSCERHQNLTLDEDNYVVPPREEDALYSQLESTMEYLNRPSIKYDEKLGSGQFGDVYKGVWLSPRGKVDVAVKTLREHGTEKDRIKFLQEAAIMGQFKDPNVVTLYGVVIAGEPFLLVLELLHNGDLVQHLQYLWTESAANNICLDGHIFLSYSRQIASGMAYLSGMGFVHRDLAARNILLSDQGLCKIADFGMARDLLYETYSGSRGELLPVKWTAPEAVHRKIFSTASDVWSFGVVLYEIWSVGQKPFADLTNNKVITVVDSGCRLSPPPGCPRRMYALMISCWHPEPLNRPSFLDVRSQLFLPDSTLLEWRNEDREVDLEAFKLGGSLLAAKNLYCDLQNIYM